MLEELIEKLKSGVVKFSYAKKDGEERIAFGTVNPDLVPIQYTKPQIQSLYEASENLLTIAKRVHEASEVDTADEKTLKDAIDLYEVEVKPFRPKSKRESSGEKKSSNYISYYDFEAKGFRLFNPDSLIKIY